jgi:hypothetical protein
VEIKARRLWKAARSWALYASKMRFSSARTVSLRLLSSCFRMADGEGDLGSSDAFVRWANPLAASPIVDSINKTQIALRSLFRYMARNTPSVRAATLTEISPLVAFPAAKRFATLIVFDATNAGTLADATFCERIAANAPPDNVMPR